VPGGPSSPLEYKANDWSRWRRWTILPSMFSYYCCLVGPFYSLPAAARPRRSRTCPGRGFTLPGHLHSAVRHLLSCQKNRVWLL